MRKKVALCLGISVDGGLQCGHMCRSDAWVGEFQKASSGLSTNEDAKKSANAIFQVHACTFSITHLLPHAGDCPL